MSKKITFQSYISAQEAQNVSFILSENGIDNELVSNSPSVDLTLTGGGISSQRIELKINHEEFEAANKILELEADKAIDSVDKDHYLFDFSNEELFDVLLKKEEWSAFDFELTKKILEERGESVSEALLNQLRVQRIEDLAKPDQGQSAWIIVGYLLAFLGGFFGLAIGWYLWKFKKTLPNGDKVFASSKSDRNHGKNIFIIGIIGMIIWLYFSWK